MPVLDLGHTWAGQGPGNTLPTGGVKAAPSFYLPRPPAPTPPWAKGREPGLLPGLVRVDPEMRFNGSARQSGGNLSPLRYHRRAKKVARDVRDSSEVDMYGWKGRHRRTDQRDCEIRWLRRQIEQNGGDKWFDPNPPEPEWDLLEEWYLRWALAGNPPTAEEEEAEFLELGWLDF